MRQDHRQTVETAGHEGESNSILPQDQNSHGKRLIRREKAQRQNRRYPGFYPENPALVWMWLPVPTPHLDRQPA